MSLGTALRKHFIAVQIVLNDCHTAARAFCAASRGWIDIDILISFDGFQNPLRLGKEIRNTNGGPGINVFIQKNIAHPADIDLRRRLTVERDGYASAAVRDNPVIGIYNAVGSEHAFRPIGGHRPDRSIQQDHFPYNQISRFHNITPAYWLYVFSGFSTCLNTIYL